MSRLYVTSRRLGRLLSLLSERDHCTIATLATTRLATATQLERVCFAAVGQRQRRKRLAWLVDQRVAGRLTRQIGGIRAGSAGYVYVLDTAGVHIARAHGLLVTRRPWTPGLPFLQHSLAVTEVYVRTVEAERAGRLNLIDFAAEPRSWRRLADPGGGSSTVKPDATLIVRVDGYEDHWFVEVDRGTEAPATIARKCDQYRRLWSSGTEQARLGLFPRVLWLVPDDKRQRLVTDICARQPAEAWQIFTVTQFDEVIDRIVAGAAS